MADLSPATRDMVAAFDDRYELCGPFDDNWQELCLAAALRALADHQPAPITLGQPIDHWCPGARIRQELRNIAAELEGDKKAAEPDLITKATSSPETCNRQLDKCMSVTSDQLEVFAEIFSETDRADKISLHCDPVTRTVTIRYEDLDDGWFHDLCNLKSSLNS